jgi:hypothetical protein
MAGLLAVMKRHQRFIEKKEIFSELQSDVSPGQLKNVIEQSYEAILKLIEEHKTDEDNHFYSR